MSFDLSNRPEFARAIKTKLLAHLKEGGLDATELDLFDWYVKETEALGEQMLATEQTYIQSQIDSGLEDLNDSGMIPVQYFIRRTRYSHAIYIASLGETYLKDAIRRLTTLLGDNLPFKLAELSGKDWLRERRYLERYGRFVIPDEVWKGFMGIYKVRNALAHENGNVDTMYDEDRERLIKQYAGIPGISVGQYELNVEPSYIAYAIGSLKALASFLDGEIAQLVDRAIKPQVVSPES
jgi:hypothetical protein